MQSGYSNAGLVKCVKKKKKTHNFELFPRLVCMYQGNIGICHGGCSLVLDLPNRARGERHIERGAQRYLFCCGLPASGQTSSSSCPKDDKQRAKRVNK